MKALRIAMYGIGQRESLVRAVSVAAAGGDTAAAAAAAAAPAAPATGGRGADASTRVEAPEKVR